MIEGVNDLATLKPELADEWSSKNDPLNPTCLLVLFHISASCCPMQRYNNFSVYLFSFNFFRVFRLDDILLSRVDKVLLALSYPPASINLHVFVVIADGVECNHILAILIVDEGGKGIGGARGVSIVLEMTCWPF
mgnify:CR=1 FL=1